MALETEVYAGIRSEEGHLDGPRQGAKFAFPYRLAEDSQGTIYVVERNKRHLRRINPSGDVDTLATARSGQTAVELGVIWSVDVASDDTVYVYANSRLWRGTVEPGSTELRLEVGPKVPLDDFVLTSDRRMIATSSEGLGLLRVSWTGSVEEMTGPGAFSGDLALSAGGDLYVTGSHRYVTGNQRYITAPRVLKMTRGSTSPEHFAPTNQRPDERGPETWFTDSMGGIDLDGNGNLYVADGFGYVFRASTDGSVSIALDLDEGVSDVLVSKSGHLYVTDYSNHAVLRSIAAIAPPASKHADPL